MERSRLEPLDVSPEDGADYTEIVLPDELAGRVGVLVDLDQIPRTLGEVAALSRETKTFATGDTLTWQDLLVSEEETRHKVRTGDDAFHTYCILDALILPFILDRRVGIRSHPPAGGAPIEIEVTPHRLEATPPSAVVSFGVTRAFPRTADELDDPRPTGRLDRTHADGCPAINAFPDRDAYASWHRETEAATVVMTLAQAYAMAHDTAGAIEA